MLQVLTILCVFALTNAGKLSRHRLVRVDPSTPAQADGLERFKTSSRKQVDFWGDLRSTAGQPQLVRVPPEQMDMFQAAMMDLGISYNVTIDDIEKEILRQRAEDVNHDLYNLDLEQYNRHDVIDRWLDEIAGQCEGRCSVFNTGLSHERRPMRGIRIIGNGQATTNIVVEGGMHSQEWISIAAVVWLIDTWVHGYNAEANLRRVIDLYNWYFLPCGNPDGYEFTHSHGDPEFRLWRKTRRPFPGNDCDGEPHLAHGVDLNRNYNFYWGIGVTSPNPCDTTYMGPSPFSEPESQNSANYIQGLSNVVGYYSLHSFGQMILHPWAGTMTDSPDRPMQEALGNVGRNAIIEANGGVRDYRVGSSANVFENIIGGTGLDWAYGNLRLTYAYIVNLPDTGFYGFLLPAAYIRPVGEEMTAMLVAMALP